MKRGTNRNGRRCLAVLATAAATFAMGSPARAQLFWNHQGNPGEQRFFSDASNWDPSRVPSSGDTCNLGLYFGEIILGFSTTIGRLNAFDTNTLARYSGGPMTLTVND